jgi:2-polyprenyl-6-hydroxyphenyl methylase / 3-demethylubiquinone-9 3-methyltransferase
MLMTHTVETEIEKFEKLSHAWWNTQGELRTLHHLNPCRMAYVEKHTPIINKRILDMGCGGGIFTEALAKAGAIVTGIDLSETAIAVAKKHAEISGLNIDYFHEDITDYAKNKAEYFDVIVCMELLEHVENPEKLIETLAACLKPDGKIFFSTLNRTPTAYCLAILAAEYVLNLIPKGTHDYARFIKPSEMATFARHAGLSLVNMSGLAYNPLQKKASLTSSLSINYLACFSKDIVK